MRTLENIEALAKSLRENPSSTRHRPQKVNISRISLRRFLQKDLGMTPYIV